MKRKKFFPGIVLIGFGIYFFLQQMQISLFDQFFSWPTLLFIIGIAFLFQAYGAKDNSAILPGVILTGFSVHFHVAGKLDFWPDHIGALLLIISLGFLLQYQKTGEGLLQGLLFLIISSLFLFYEQVINWLGLLESKISAAEKFWPVALIAFGIYFLLANKK